MPGIPGRVSNRRQLWHNGVIRHQALCRDCAVKILGIGGLPGPEQQDFLKAPSLVLLVVAVTDTKIDARNICTQDRLSFDRASGIAGGTDERLLETDQPVTCTIDSVARLPVDMHNVLIGLDRRFRLEHDWERIKLTDAEVRALSYVQRHYAANPL